MEDDNRILGIIACFYDENGEKVYKCKSTLSNEVTSFDSDPLVKKYSDGKWKILVMPYYLFENQEVTNLKGQMDKENMDLYKAYEKYEKLPEFIWSKPLPKPAENISDALNKLEEASEKFKNVMGHGKAYQKLYCLIVFNKDESIDDVLYADPFALTIKEWGSIYYIMKLSNMRPSRLLPLSWLRNISHNIGSHVITYWNAHLKGILFPSADWDNESKWFAMPNYSILAFENKYPNVINQSRNLLQYVQQRMDFIADISTTYHPLSFQ